MTGPIEVQTRAALNALKTTLEAGSSLANVVKVRVYVTDPAMMSGVNTVYREFFAGDWPTRRTLQLRAYCAIGDDVYGNGDRRSPVGDRFRRAISFSKNMPFDHHRPPQRLITAGSPSAAASIRISVYSVKSLAGIE